MANDSVGNKQATVYSILLIISFGHFLNDMIQSVIPSVYPILRDDYNLSFLQIGIITFVAQMTSSIMQPVVGRYTDRHPHPYSLTAGMMFTLAGILLLSVASSFGVILLAVATVGIGSAVFHPESSRIAQNAAGVKKRTRTVYFSGRRKRRNRPRSATCRCHNTPIRAKIHIMVCHCGSCRHRGTVLCGQMVQDLIAFGQKNRHLSGCKKSVAETHTTGVVHSLRAHILEIFLYGEHDKLLHFLSNG